MSVEIVDSTFITSAPSIKLTPPNIEQNEVVFIARSNSGKSSLLNALTNRKSLAKVSSTPGKTRLINYFHVTFKEDETKKIVVPFVDLPGFGYAKVSKSILSDWEKNLTDYIKKRKQIKIFIHLIDARHTNLEIDESVDNFLNQNLMDTQVILKVFTKIDKLNQSELQKLRIKYPHSLMVSSSKKRGIKELNEKIYLILSENNE